MPNIGANYRLYPRGFIGGVPAARMEKTVVPDIPRNIGQLLSHQFHVNKFKYSDEQIFPNPEVEALYASYIKQTGDVTSSDFWTKVLDAALTAFGTQDFDTWVYQQRNSPAYSDRHHRFLCDMIRFISGDRPELMLSVWNSLLVVDAGSPPAPKGPEPVFQNFFAYFPESKRLTNLIQMWCSKQGGVEHMLQTLHLLFGDF